MTRQIPRPRILAERAVIIAPLLPSIALSVACAESGPPGSGTTRSDSVGVEIVVSSLPTWSPESAPVASLEPRLRIGSLDGPEETQLFDVRFATVLSDGRIVIGNNGSSELRFFGADGRFEFAVGGEGEGPGEFRSLFPVFTRLPGDTLRLFDGRTRRITEYTGSGEFVRSTALDPPNLGDYGVFYAGTFQDSRLAASTVTLPPTSEMADGDLVRGERTYWAFETPDGTAHEVARLLDRELIARVVDGNMRIQTLPFRSSDQAVPHTDLIVASTDRHEVRWYTPDGILRRIASWDGEVRKLTSERYDEWLNGLTPERIEEIRDRHEGVPLPPRLPLVQSMLVDEAGNAWLEPFRLVPSEPNVWTVIGADGAWLGSVELPSGLRPYEIGEDYVIGLWRDELDVSYVHVHELTWRP